MSTVRYTIRETLLASTIRHTLRGYGGGGAAPPVDPPAELAFHALTPDDTTYEMLGVKTGTGDLTTTHTADLYAPDSDDVYRQFAANEAVYSGGRVVNNYILNSDDLTAASWLLQTLTVTSGITDPDGGSTAVTLTATSGNAAFYTGNGLGEADQPAIMSLWIRRRTGTGTIEIETPGVRRLDLTSIITGSWQRVTTTTQETQSNTRFALWITSSGDEVDIWQPALQSKALGVGVGSSLLGTPEFDSDSDWTKGTGWSIAAGVAHCDGTQTSNSDLKQIMTGIDEAFQFVTVTVEFSNISAGSVTFFPVGLDSHTITENGVYSYIEARGSSPINYQVFIRADADFVGDVEYCRAGLTEVLNGDIPEEYVATGASAVTKVFGSQNGNTVASNVVTEATGTPLAEAPYLSYYPAATNLCLYSNDLTGWNDDTNITGTFDQVGLTGEPNTASLASASSSAVSGEDFTRSFTVSTASVKHTFVYYIGKLGSSPPAEIEIVARATALQSADFNAFTGALTENGTFDATEVIDLGDWWKVLLEITSTSTGTGYCQIYPTTINSTANNTVIGNVEVYEASAAQVRGLGPIFTTSASVSTDKTVYTFDTANNEIYKSVLYLEYWREGDYDGTSRYQNMFLQHSSYNGNAPLQLDIGSNNRVIDRYINTSDGADALYGTSGTIPAQVAHQIACVYHDTDAKLTNNVDGTYDATEKTDFKSCNVVAGQPLKFINSYIAFPDPVDFKIRNLRRYDITSYQQGKDTIDALMAEPPAELAFLALSPDDTTYEMLGVKTGTGDLTTTHTATLYEPDFEGVYKPFVDNRPVWSGGRFVSNIGPQEDFTVTSGTLNGWDQRSNVAVVGGQTDPDGGNTAYRVTATNTNGQMINSNGTVNKPPAGSVLRASCWVRRVTGTGTVELLNGQNFNNVTDITSQIDGTWKRVAADLSLPLTGGTNYQGFYLSVSGDEIDVWHHQLEDVTGKANQNPSEYVAASTVLAGLPEIAPFKVFANQNGNTVASNVVTEAVGTPLAEAPYLSYYPAATNTSLNSFDLSGAAWGGSANVTYILDAIGLTGEPNAATTVNITADGGNPYNAQNHTVTTASRVTVKYWLKKTTAAVNFPATRIYYESNSQRIFFTFDTDTGAAVLRSDFASSGTYFTEVIDDGDWWVFLIQLDHAATAKLLEIRYYAGVNNDGSGDWTIGAFISSHVVGNIETHLDKTIAQVRGLGPIFTTSASVSTDQTNYAFDYTNHAQASGAYYTETQLAGLTAGQKVIINLSVANAGLLYWQDTTSYRTFDGTNFPDLTTSVSEDTLIQVANVYHDTDNKLNINVDGVYATETAYDGAFNTASTIRLDSTSSPIDVAKKMRNLRRYDITSYQQGKDTIDGLMINYLTGDSFNDYLTDGLGNRLTV